MFTIEYTIGNDEKEILTNILRFSVNKKEFYYSKQWGNGSCGIILPIENKHFQIKAIRVIGTK